jgi:hypothetical protein
MGFLQRLFGGDSPSPKRANLESLNIVGESFYQANFKKIRSFSGAKVGDKIQIVVNLRNENNNPHSPNGRAVSVNVQDLKVGYVAQYQVDRVFELLENTGGTKSVKGTIYFADGREKIVKNSVTAELAIPVPEQVNEPQKTAQQISADSLQSEKVEEQRQKYLGSNWDKVKIQKGDSVFVSLSNQFLANALKSAIVSGGAVAEQLTKSKTKLVVIDSVYLQKDSRATRDLLRWAIPVTNFENFEKDNPNFATNKALRERFFQWDAHGENFISAQDFNDKLRISRDKGELIPGLTFAPELYGHAFQTKLVFVEKRKEAIQQVIEELKVLPGDGFAVPGELKLISESEKVISVSYRDLDLGQIPSKEFDHFEFRVRNDYFSKLKILGILDTANKVSLYVIDSAM